MRAALSMRPRKPPSFSKHSSGRWSLRCEKFLQLRIDEVDILWIGAGTPGEVAPDRGNGDKMGVRHVCHLELAILRRKIQISLARHDIGPRLDCAECRLEVAVLESVVADIAVLPNPVHGQQIVWVLPQEENPSQNARLRRVAR